MGISTCARGSGDREEEFSLKVAHKGPSPAVMGSLNPLEDM